MIRIRRVDQQYIDKKTKSTKYYIETEVLGNTSPTNLNEVNSSACGFNRLKRSLNKGY